MMDYGYGWNGGWQVLFGVLGFMVVILLFAILMVLINKKKKD